MRELTRDVVHQSDAAQDVAAAVEVHDEAGRGAFTAVDPDGHTVDDVVGDARDLARRRETDRAARELEQLRDQILEGRLGALRVGGHPLDDPRIEHTLVGHGLGW